ncbi:UNVERIFIED_CONTAM: hypothetical protein Sradi_1819100 [Sesamum radiatum]|uniref:Uncharacterized protein n=1 Tax=Sesamum radiatum TaxID=300843 RepID=A0AAW2TX49_SESRA
MDLVAVERKLGESVCRALGAMDLAMREWMCPEPTRHLHPAEKTVCADMRLLHVYDGL